MELPNIGKQELELLYFVIDHASVTVREAVVEFGEPRGLARTTILTVMERLRGKGYLSRENRSGVFKYSANLPKMELMRRLTCLFVREVLDGSVDPLVSYLSQDAKGTDEKLMELRRLVDALDGKQDERPISDR